MTMLYPNLYFSEACYTETALYYHMLNVAKPWDRKIT